MQSSDHTEAGEAAAGSAVAATERPARVVCILGMHRSGTSCLAGSLEQHGLSLGEHNTWSSPHNRKGNNESNEVVLLNDEVLRTNGGGWNVPPQAPRWSCEQLRRARDVLARYAHLPVWGFKDPRALFTVSGWELLVPDLAYAGIFRDPSLVARSLNRRDEIPLAHGVGLWRRYNERLLEIHRAKPFPLLSFDAEPDELQSKIELAAQLLGLDAPVSEEPFFSRELRSDGSVDQDLPKEAAAVYRELQARAL